MNFRVSARTILHLGSELISSDGIAFYELIKNSLDARSSEITVDVIYRLRHDVYADILRELGEDRTVPEGLRRRGPANERRSWRELRDVALDALIPGAPRLGILERTLSRATSKRMFLKALRSANLIEIDDNGEGMSLDILRDVYLTIGTSYRAEQRRALARRTRDDGSEDLILGEKGIGRLSTMRLGDELLIVTGEEDEPNWNQLRIDWNDFADAADADLESVPVAPEIGDGKEPSEQGTLVRISALRSEWSEEKLHNLARDHFSKLVDPLGDRPRLPLTLRFNEAEVAIPTFADFLLGQAHGRFHARLITDGRGAPRIEGLMEYIIHNRREALNLSSLELHTLTGAEVSQIRRVGPFELDMYWFNRRLLTKIEGIGNLTVVRRILSEWAGGVSLYRDGYRVNPYGNPDDDWLDLDRDAFSTSGFKLNRGQIIGRARISQRRNPYLIDQTNREGLKDTPEERTFRTLLSSIVELYRQYLNQIDRDIDRARRVTAAEAIERFQEEDERVGALLPALDQALSETAQGRALSSRLRATLSDLRAAAEVVQRAAGAQDRERSRVLHLASIGLMIESLAHELYRATAAGLDTISQARRASDPRSSSTSLRVLDSQLRTLQKRLKVLDPLSTNARQTKENFELTKWIDEIVEGFANRNQASGVEIELEVAPDGAELPVRAVKGMFVQVLENLLTNSMFWVVAQHRQRVKSKLVAADEQPVGHINIEVDVPSRRITVTDDGPGIPEERRETVFEPFFSTKPQKQGKGLGLYIAREIADYHGGTLTLGPADADGKIHSVIFEIGNIDG